jgi:FkbM family methyltransferase
VYAFEPIPSTYEILRRNVEINGLRRRVIPINAAVGDVTETLSIRTYNLGNIGGTSLKKDPAGTIPAITLDNFTFPEKHIDFMKMDVEGFEVHVIKGALEFLRKFHPTHIFIEIFSGESQRWMLETLGQFGYVLAGTYPASNFLYRWNTTIKSGA